MKTGGTRELPVWKAEAEQGDLCSGELDDLLVGSHLLAGQLGAVLRGGRTGCLTGEGGRSACGVLGAGAS